MVELGAQLGRELRGASLWRLSLKLLSEDVSEEAKGLEETLSILGSRTRCDTLQPTSLGYRVADCRLQQSIPHNTLRDVLRGKTATRPRVRVSLDQSGSHIEPTVCLSNSSEAGSPGAGPRV